MRFAYFIEELPLHTISILLADDNRDMLSDLRDELSGEFSIAGMVGNGEEAIQEVPRLNPNILVLDITMHWTERYSSCPMSSRFSRQD